MNDPSTFVNGSTTACVNNSINYPPFIPVTYSPMFTTTMCLDARHHSGIHLAYHNVFGHYEALHTFGALSRLFPHRRPFVLTRSTAPGTARFAAKWMGDTFSTWADLNQSLVALLEGHT